MIISSIVSSMMYACVYIRPLPIDKIQFEEQIICGMVMSDKDDYVRLFNFKDKTITYFHKDHILKYWYMDYLTI